MIIERLHKYPILLDDKKKKKSRREQNRSSFNVLEALFENSRFYCDFYDK